MPKNGITTLKQVGKLLNIVATNVADIKSEMTGMATKKDLEAFATKFDLQDAERRLSNKIDGIDTKIDALEEGDIRSIQGRVSVLEKDVKILKHKHG